MEIIRLPDEYNIDIYRITHAIDEVSHCPYCSESINVSSDPTSCLKHDKNSDLKDVMDSKITLSCTKRIVNLRGKMKYKIIGQCHSCNAMFASNEFSLDDENNEDLILKYLGNLTYAFENREHYNLSRTYFYKNEIKDKSRGIYSDLEFTRILLLTVGIIASLAIVVFIICLIPTFIEGVH